MQKQVGKSWEEGGDERPLCILIAILLVAGPVPVAEIKVPKVNGERQQILNDPNRIFPVNGEIRKAQQATQQAAFPKTKGNDAFFGFFRGDSLQDKAQAEHNTAGKADHFPCIQFKSV